MYSSDTEKKKLYDQYGFAAFEEGFGAGGQNAGGQGGFSALFMEDLAAIMVDSHEYHFEGGNMDDMGDIFGDIFGNMFHGQKGSGFGGRTNGFGGSRTSDEG